MEPEYLSREIRKANIDNMLGRNDEESIEKGGKPAVLGEKRMFGGREYIKTVEGWKFHGKGTGEKAQQHAAAHKTSTEEKKYDLDALHKQKHERETKQNATQAKRRATLEKKNKSLHTTDKSLEKVKEKYNEAKRSLSSIEKRIEKMTADGFSYSKDRWKKQAWNKIFTEKDTAERKIEKILYNHSQLKSIFAERGLSATTRSSTAIRGYTTASRGYEFPSHNQSTIHFNRIDANTFLSIKNDIEAAGFKIKDISAPAASIGGRSVASIQIEPFYSHSSLNESDTAVKKEEPQNSKTIGHTKSGKLVYEDFDKKHYENFTKEDHQEASIMHQKIAEEHLNSREYEGGYGISDSTHEAAKRAKMKHSDASQFHHSSYLSKKNEEVNQIGGSFISAINRLSTTEKDKLLKLSNNVIDKATKAGFSTYINMRSNTIEVCIKHNHEDIESGGGKPEYHFMNDFKYKEERGVKINDKLEFDVTTGRYNGDWDTDTISSAKYLSLFKNDIKKSIDEDLQKAFETLGLNGI